MARESKEQRKADQELAFVAWVEAHEPREVEPVAMSDAMGRVLALTRPLAQGGEQDESDD